MQRKASLVSEVIMFIVALVFLFPIFFLVEMSFKAPRIFYEPFQFPIHPFLGNYTSAFQDMDFPTGLFNSTLLTVCSLCLTIIIASMAGYMITRMKYRFFQFCMIYFLAGMIIPGIGSLIPLFKLSIFLHLYNTGLLLILLYVTGHTPFAVFLYAAFTKAIPWELEESASMDGCSRWRTFWRIIFPLLLPATGTFILTNVYGIWNDFLQPLIFLNEPGKMPLMPQIVQFMFNKQSVNLGPVFSVAVLAVLPLVILFLFTQKYMLKGLMLGSVKG